MGNSFKFQATSMHWLEIKLKGTKGFFIQYFRTSSELYYKAFHCCLHQFCGRDATWLFWCCVSQASFLLPNIQDSRLSLNWADRLYYGIDFKSKVAGRAGQRILLTHKNSQSSELKPTTEFYFHFDPLQHDGMSWNKRHHQNTGI